MPRLSLYFGGPFLETVNGSRFFPPLFAELSKKPSINLDLLKGFAMRIDDFAIGRQKLLACSHPKSFVHLEMAVLKNRRSDEELDDLTTCMEIYTEKYFQQSLCDPKKRCYITCDIKAIDQRWHRSIARGQRLNLNDQSRVTKQSELSSLAQRIGRLPSRQELAKAAPKKARFPHCRAPAFHAARLFTG